MASFGDLPHSWATEETDSLVALGIPTMLLRDCGRDGSSEMPSACASV